LASAQAAIRRHAQAGTGTTVPGELGQLRQSVNHYTAERARLRAMYSRALEREVNGDWR